MGLIDATAKKMKRELLKRAGAMAWCSKGGQHEAKSRSDSAKCLKCGMSIVEIKKQISASVKEKYPEQTNETKKHSDKRTCA